MTASSAICVVPTPPDFIIKLPLPSVSIVTSSICILSALRLPVVISPADIAPKTPEAEVSVPAAISPATIVLDAIFAETIVDSAIALVVIVHATISEAVTAFAAILS